MNSYALPPGNIAHFMQNTTVAGVATEQWSWNLFGFETNVWVEMSADGKNDLLRKFTQKVPVVGTMGATFKTMEANAVSDADFDVTSRGCPPIVPPPAFKVAGFVTDAVSGEAIVGAAVSIKTRPSAASTKTSTNGTQCLSAVQNCPPNVVHASVIHTT